SGIPALVVTHDLAEARALSDRLALLIDGRVVADGPTGDVLAAPATGPAALLLGWRNVLPLAALTPDGASDQCATLPGGQRLRVVGPCDSPPAGAALALNADRLELRAAGEAEATSETGDCLRAHVRGVADYGAYTLVQLALDGAEGPALDVTCSPREWAALAARPDDPVAVRVPAGAARLVGG
ncbi:MAG TPA: hypothetical protein VGR88_02775, partial [Ktedonobacterales bacterium]|nr:hypothetical protein [Ktedonobacterales bacterium]